MIICGTLGLGTDGDLGMGAKAILTHPFGIATNPKQSSEIGGFYF